MWYICSNHTVATCTLDCVATCTLDCVATCTLDCVATCTLDCVATCTLNCVATCTLDCGHLHFGLCGHLHFGLWPLALWTVCDCWDSNCSTNGICSMQHELSTTDILCLWNVSIPQEGNIYYRQVSMTTEVHGA